MKVKINKRDFTIGIFILLAFFVLLLLYSGKMSNISGNVNKTIEKIIYNE